MFQPGKVVHEPARRSSQDASKAAKPGGLSTLAASAATGAESATRFIYRPGKEVHEPSRKKSMSESKPTPPVAAAAPTSPTTSTASTATTSTIGAGAAAGRRRVSNVSSESFYASLYAPFALVQTYLHPPRAPLHVLFSPFRFKY